MKGATRTRENAVHKSSGVQVFSQRDPAGEEGQEEEEERGEEGSQQQAVGTSTLRKRTSGQCFSTELYCRQGRAQRAQMCQRPNMLAMRARALPVPTSIWGDLVLVFRARRADSGFRARKLHHELLSPACHQASQTSQAAS